MRPAGTDIACGASSRLRENLKQRVREYRIDPVAQVNLS